MLNKYSNKIKQKTVMMKKGEILRFADFLQFFSVDIVLISNNNS